MLMETFLKPEQPAFHIKGYKTVHMDRINDKGGGIAFLIKKGLIYDIIDLKFKQEAIEAVTLSVSCSLGNITLVACYRSPTGNNNISPSEWESFLQSIKKNRKQGNNRRRFKRSPRRMG